MLHEFGWIICVGGLAARTHQHGPLVCTYDLTQGPGFWKVLILEISPLGSLPNFFSVCRISRVPSGPEQHITVTCTDIYHQVLWSVNCPWAVPPLTGQGPENRNLCFHIQRMLEIHILKVVSPSLLLYFSILI